MATREHSASIHGRKKEVAYNHETSQAIGWIGRVEKEGLGLVVIQAFGDGPHVVAEKDITWKVDPQYSDNYSFASFEPVVPPNSRQERAVVVCPDEEALLRLQAQVRGTKAESAQA